MAPRDATASSGRKVITMAELKKHASPNDAWVAINGKVYDVSKWQAHPGGRVIFTTAGGDATDSFRAFHSGAANDMLERFYTGELEASATKVNAFETEYRALVATMKSKGLFTASLPFYAWKFASTTSILVAAAYVTLSSTTVAGQMGGALICALFWQQCGWLAHDFAHHQVFKNRRLNDLVVLIVGDLYQGFSLDWWKAKHNTHHSIPNLHEKTEGAHDGDPDIDTIPFLAWSERMARKAAPGGSADSPNTRWTLAHQAALYFPILFFARLTWAWQSFAYAFQWEGAFWGAQAEGVSPVNAALRYPFAEKALISLHYAFFCSLAYVGTGSPLLALAWMVIAETVGGILLAIPFGVGHNGMTVYDADKAPGFGELQVTTTRNVNGRGFVSWFMGGLELQIEHHLFPTVPRHNLPAVRALVEPLCRKHNVPYNATTLWAGTMEVLTKLEDISELVKDFPAA